MKSIACCFLLLVILGESYCKTTSTVNRTSNSWGYDYSLSNTRGFKVNHDDKGYHFEPIYNDTSSGLKKHTSSRSVYDHFTSPGATNDSQSHSSTNDVINGKSKEPYTIIFDTPASGEKPKAPVTKTYTVTTIDTQTEAPISTDKTSSEAPSSSHSIPPGDTNRSPSVSSNRQFGSPYGSQNTPIYAAPTGPLYYPQAPTYGQMYVPTSNSMYGLSNGQIYGPPMGPMYGPPMGGTYGLTGPVYGLHTQSMYGYAPLNSQMYGPPNNRMYVPQNGQTNGYPTGSLYESNRNY